MVRNAGTLVTAMIRGGAVEALLHTVNHDSAPAPRRIALFSLGNFVGYSEVRDLLTAPQLEFESTMGAHHAVSSICGMGVVCQQASLTRLLLRY
eukprot:COSAG01_NODE_382_length_17840_cov_68.658663_17_plen_94_part_00